MAKKQKFMKHIMTGISYMIPIVVAGGILGALAKAFGGWDIGSAVAAGATPFSNLNPFTWVGFWWGVTSVEPLPYRNERERISTPTKISGNGNPFIPDALPIPAS